MEEFWGTESSEEVQEGAELLLHSDSTVELCEERQNFKRRTGGMHFVHKIVL